MKVDGNEVTSRHSGLIGRNELISLVKGYRERKFAEDIKWFETRTSDMAVFAKENLEVDVEYGLDPSADHSRRIQEYGSNRRDEREMASFFQLMLDAMKDYTLILLSIMGALSLIIGVLLGEKPEVDWIEGAAILLAVVIVVMVTAVNDYQKGKKFAELQSIHKNRQCLNFLRNGKWVTLHPSETLVGDVIELAQGSICPVDGIVLKSNHLQANEAALTGENDNTEKDTVEECLARKVDFMQSVKTEPTHDHANRELPSPIVLSGSSIAEGTGLLLAIAVGKFSTEGQISELTEQEDEQTPLEYRLDELAGQISKLGLYSALFAVIVLYGRFIFEIITGTVEWDTGESLDELLEYLIVGITVLVVAIPEGLPLAVTISLAYSVKKMQKDQNLVKRLHACETMGGANAICSDKTGTLTQNVMEVDQLCAGKVIYEGQNLRKLLSDSTEYYKLLKQCVMLTTTARVELIEGKKVELGSKTEIALLNLLQRIGDGNYEEVRKEYKRRIIHINPFSSKRKRSSIVLQFTPEHRRVYVIGASEYVLRSCGAYYTVDNEINYIDAEQANELEEKITQMASKGLRTLGIAFRDLDDDEMYTEFDSEGVPVLETHDLILIAIFGIEDPPREEVYDAIKACHTAGIKVRMVTGDNKLTAKSIAQKIGIMSENGIVLEGEEFRNLVGGVVCELCRTNECECARKANKYNKPVRVDVVGDLNMFRKTVYNLDILARSQPEDKYTLVTGLKQLGNIVAVTGDGSNDAPALKKANIGLAMGIAGTELAREAADIILLDDNFSSIVKAVLWGRNIYDSIQKFLQFQLTVNVVAVTVAIVGAVSIKQSPLTAVQLLWVNLIMDTFASLALATEPPTPDLLLRSPVKSSNFIVTPEMFKHIFGQAFLQLVIIFVMVYFGEHFLIEPDDTQEQNGDFVVSGRNYEFNGDRDYKKLYEDEGPSRHFTYVFNIFVYMQLFNELNCRKIHEEKWIMGGIGKNWMFLIIWFFTVVLQAILVSFGGYALNTHLDGLTWEQWLICMGVSFVTILWRFPLLLLPGLKLPCFHKEEKPEEHMDPKHQHHEEGIKRSITGTLRAQGRRSSQLL